MFLKLELCGRHIVLFVARVEVPTLPGCLWPGGSEKMSSSLTVAHRGREDVCWLLLLLPTFLLG